MATQQEIIKKFMASLDTTSKTGEAAVDEAINFATDGKFKTAQAVINQMISDCQSATTADNFLSDYCGIILDNSDTGAITGSDAGGSTIKTAASIVPESGSLINFTGNSFTVRGLTFKLGKWINSEETTTITVDELNDDQKFIWQSLYSYWAASALKLIEESYGYSFTDSDASVKEITVTFVRNTSSGETAATYYVDRDSPDGKIDELVLTINTAHYNNFSSGDVNGESPDGQEYLDRVIAHQLTYAIMNAKIDYRYDLPLIIVSGISELTQGIDDVRTSDLKKLAGNVSLMKQALILDTDYNQVSGITAPDYSGGYMFLRYLAKQAAAEDSNVIAGTSRNDYIENTISGVQIYGYGGADTIINGSHHTTLGSNVTIDAGDGNDYIDNFYNSSSVKIDAGAGADTISNAGSIVTIDAGEGNDYISNSGSNVKINTGTGTDTIWNYWGSSLTIDTGDGNDFIYNHAGDHSTIELGGGDDSIYNNSDSFNVTINAGEGNDSIVNAGSSVTINAGEGNDYISHSGDVSNGKIDGGSGDDSIENWGSNVTINAGAGNDTVYLNISATTLGNVYVYNSGDGNDKIYNVSNYDTISIGGASYSTQTSGSNVIISVGTGAMTLFGGSGKSFKIVGSAAPDDTTPVGISISGATLTASTAFTGNEINLADYASTVTKVNASALSRGVSIIGSAQPNNILSGSGADFLFGGDGNDSLSGGAGNDTLNGGAGNDTLVGGDGRNVFIYEGGSDVITDYTTGEGNIIILDYGKVTASTVKNKDVVLTIGNKGTITVKDAKDQKLTIYTGVDDKNPVTGIFGYYDGVGTTAITLNATFSGTLDSAEGGSGTTYYDSKVATINAARVKNSIAIYGNTNANYITASSSKATTINGGEGNDLLQGGGGNDYLLGGTENDTINGGSGKDTIDGGTGDDTLTGGNGRDVFIYGGGNDVILDYTAGQDVISLASGSIASSSLSGSDVVLKIGSGSLTVKNGKGKKITVTDSAGNITTQTYGVSDDTVPTGISISGEILTASTAFTGNEINLADYASTVTKVNASALSRGISIVGSAKANSIKGGSGADTIFGGAGNDTVSFGAGNDVYIYSGGNDVIQDYAAGDSISLASGSISAYSNSGSDAVFKIGSNTLKVKNGKGKEIIVNGKTYPTVETGVTINNSTANTVLTGTAYADSISNSGNNVTIDSGAGDDTIENWSGASVTIDTGAGNDTIFNGNRGYVSINGGAGDDSISNLYSYNTIDGGNGNDYIYSQFSYNLIFGGEGADIVSIITYSGAGKHTISGGTGNDTVYLSSATTLGNVYVYNSGDGSDTIYNVTKYDTVSIGGASYSTSTSGNNLIVSVGSGKMTFVNAKDTAFKILPEQGPAYPKSLTSGADKVTISDDNATVYALAGNDVLTITGNAGYFDGGAGTDKISLGTSATKITMTGGAGTDSLYTNGNGNLILYGASNGKDIISGFGGNDSISISGAISKTTQSGANVLITVGSSSNVITIKNVAQNNLSIEGGVITYTTIPPAPTYPKSLTSGADSLTISDNAATVYGLAGNDIITITGNAGYFDGGAGTDKISIGTSATKITMTGGAGTDSLYTNGKGNLILYGASNGKDIISGFGGNDSISISGALKNPVAKNKDVLITVGSGTSNVITVKNVALDNLSINGGVITYTTIPPEPTYPRTLTSGDDSATISVSSVYLDAGAGKDKISISGGAENVTVYGGKGDDTIYSSGKKNIFVYNAGDGNDSITGSSASDTLKITGGTYSLAGNIVSVYSGDTFSGKITFKNTVPKIDGKQKVDDNTETGVIMLTAGSDNYTNTATGATIDALAGADNIKNTANDVSISGGAGNDIISLGADASNVTITGGAGNDKIYTNGNGNILEYASGNGNDIVYGFGGDDSISISGTAILAQNKSGDAVITVGKNSITLKNVDSNDLNLDENNIITLGEIQELYLQYNKKLVELPFERAIIHGSSSNDNYLNLGINVTIDGANGNDTICNDQKDVSINGGADNDRISLGSDANNITIYGGTGDDTIYTNGNQNIIEYDSGDGDDIIRGFDNNDSIKFAAGINVSTVWSGSSMIFRIGDDDGSVFLRDVASEEFKIKNNVVTYQKNSYIDTYSFDSDEITNTTKSRIIKALDGDDIISNSGTSVQIIAGADNDSVVNSGNNTTIYGGEGNDTIASSSNSAIIFGGTGDDLISLGGSGAHNNRIQYSEDDGKDIIYGFSGKDTLQISGSYSTQKSGDDTVIKIGTGSITLKDTSLDNLNFEDDIITTSKAVSGGNGLWFADDDNFISNENNLDAISKISADYSTGDFSATNLKTLAQDENFVTYSDK